MSDPAELSRRALLGLAADLLAGSPLRPTESSGLLKISIFSKHFRFLQGEALAQRTADIGFDAIDLTVRKNGHVEPQRVAEDLPKLVAIIRQHNLECSMITTDIADANSPYAEDIFRAMRTSGIRYYRWGGFQYDYSKPMAPQLEALKGRVAKLADLNAQYNVTAMYHTHSGVGVVGASIWDLHIILKEFNPDAVGVNYDIGHATIEGGLGGWINSFQITGPHLRGIAVKDCDWKKGANGKWKPEFVPLGSGMVHFEQFFRMVKQSGFHGPLQVHFEYPLGGANEGATELTISQEEVFGAMKRDLRQLCEYLKDAAL
jgi:sugar phosphate isomerase/epimerase